MCGHGVLRLSRYYLSFNITQEKSFKNHKCSMPLYSRLMEHLSVASIRKICVAEPEYSWNDPQPWKITRMSKRGEGLKISTDTSRKPMPHSLSHIGDLIDLVSSRCLLQRRRRRAEGKVDPRNLGLFAPPLTKEGGGGDFGLLRRRRRYPGDSLKISMEGKKGRGIGGKARNCPWRLKWCNSQPPVDHLSWRQ